MPPEDTPMRCWASRWMLRRRWQRLANSPARMEHYRLGRISRTICATSARDSFLIRSMTRHRRRWRAISRVSLFVSGFRRLYFTQHMLGTDVSNRLNTWWTLLKDHRFALVIAGFDRTGKLADKEVVAFVRGLDLLEIYQRMPWMIQFVKQ